MLIWCRKGSSYIVMLALDHTCRSVLLLKSLQEKLSCCVWALEIVLTNLTICTYSNQCCLLHRTGEHEGYDEEAG